MLHGRRVAVIVPAFRATRQLGRMLRRVPAFVDDVVVVDDACPEGSGVLARGVGDQRVRVLVHGENRGVGAAIVTGYRAALDGAADLLAVMAGDDQMDPDDLEALLAPLVRGEADYVKGNRFEHPEVARMPRARRVGGLALGWLTRRLSGLAVSDPQCGYTALAAEAARALPLETLWPRYGYPNDLLVLLGRRGFRVAEVTVRPVYADERSGLGLRHVPVIAGVALRRWWTTTPTLLLGLALGGCSDAAPTAASTPDAAGWATPPMPVAGSACGAVVQRHALQDARHVEECSPLAFSTDPPSSGAHYGRWPAFGAYDEAVPWGYLVHGLEHGAVVFTWRCGAACTDLASGEVDSGAADADTADADTADADTADADTVDGGGAADGSDGAPEGGPAPTPDEVAAARASFEALPVDPLCALQSGSTRRALFTPSVTLGARWAASAWGVTLASDCFEPDVFRDFYTEYVGRGPERVCAEGSPLRAEGGVGLALPAGCGR